MRRSSRHDWGGLTSRALQEAAGQGAVPVLPVGSVEQHAAHLPLDTDLVGAELVACAAAERCTAARVLVLPPLAFGFAPEHAAWPGTITLSLGTFLAILADVARAVRRSGFDRLLVVNGHGGNQAALTAACAEIGADGFLLAAVNYWSPGEPAWRAALPGAKRNVGHACAYETALQMALRPERAGEMAAAAAGLPPVLSPPALVGDGRAFREAGAAYPPRFPRTAPGYYGDPAAATLVAGQELLAHTVAGLAAFYGEFARARLVQD